MCQLTGVSRATYYRSLAQAGAQPQDGALRKEVRRIARARQYYGSRRILRELSRHGWRVGRARVQRIVRQDGLQCSRRRRRWLATTDSRHALPVFPNLVREWRPTRINQLWVCDITSIELQHGRAFLAAILDAFSRRVIGWALDLRVGTPLCLEALQMALRARHYPRGVIHHSDRGVQYCSLDYRAVLKKYQLRGSMSRKRNPYDNALAESFWKTLKSEHVYRQEYRTLEQARADIGGFIERIYNRQRLHSALGYHSPVQFEALRRVP